MKHFKYRNVSDIQTITIFNLIQIETLNRNSNFYLNKIENGYGFK